MLIMFGFDKNCPNKTPQTASMNNSSSLDDKAPIWLRHTSSGFSAGQGVGDIVLGSDLSSAISMLGIPNKTQITKSVRGEDIKILTYSAEYSVFYLTVDKKDVIRLLRVRNTGPNWADTSPSANGVSVGDSVQLVEAKFGTPRQKESISDDQCGAFYGDKTATRLVYVGLSFFACSKNGKLVEINVFK